MKCIRVCQRSIDDFETALDFKERNGMVYFNFARGSADGVWDKKKEIIYTSSD